MDRVSKLEDQKNTQEKVNPRSTRSKVVQPDLTDNVVDILNRLTEVETIVTQLNDCSTQTAATATPLTTKEFTAL